MPDYVYQLTPHLTYETMFNGRLSVFRIDRGDRSTIERWGTEAAAQLSTPDTSELRLILHDFTTTALNLYPLMMRWGQQVVEDTGSELIKVAIVFPRSATLQSLITPMLQNLEQGIMDTHPNRTLRLFDSREAALQWLESFLPTP